MYEDEHEGKAEGRANIALGSNPPGDASKELERREQISEGRVGKVVCVFGFCWCPRPGSQSANAEAIEVFKSRRIRF